ncbi:hypothetical protein DFH09DRAFT_891095, partial [Mycena vulgaris]
RSDISVQNPGRRRVPVGDLVRDLLRRTEEYVPCPSVPEGVRTRSNVFSNSGHTVGGSDVSRSFVPGRNAGQTEKTAIRRLTFWRDGFNLEDGVL